MDRDAHVPAPASRADQRKPCRVGVGVTEAPDQPLQLDPFLAIALPAPGRDREATAAKVAERE
jgi:hypothetical protein